MGNYIYYDYKYKQMSEPAIQGQARQKDVSYLYCNKIVQCLLITLSDFS